MTETPKHLPLHTLHASEGARFVSFAGWNMPVQYSGLIQEHLAVRQAAGLFDVSHMGEIFVRGPGAEGFLQYVCCNDLGKLVDGKAQYSALLNEQGGVVDDIIVYRFSGDAFLLCVNASNDEKDFAWLSQHAGGQKGIVLDHASSRYAQLALQGPQAMPICDEVFSERISQVLQGFHFFEREFQGARVILARTGYTGEDGVELFIEKQGEDFQAAEQLACTILQKGKEHGILPCGLGARDSLRLEAALPLHGHELAEDISALESGLGWIVRFEKDSNFIGKEALKKQKQQGLSRKLAGFLVREPGIVRGGDGIVSESGEALGVVTSGTKTPSLENPICLALVNEKALAGAQPLFALVRGRQIRLEQASLPFYRRKKGE